MTSTAGFIYFFFPLEECTYMGYDIESAAVLNSDLIETYSPVLGQDTAQVLRTFSEYYFEFWML